MKSEKKENLTNNGSDLQSDTLSDLTLAEEQAEETKGGATGGHVRVFDGRTGTLLP